MSLPNARLGIAAIAALLLQSAHAGAEEAPKALSCSFERGTTTSYAAGEFQRSASARLAFEISQIDLEGQSAHLLAGQGGAPITVRIIRALNANHFLEVVNEGFLNLTTIYDRDAATGSLPAVHSRHFGLLGQPMVAQYHGFCREKG